MRRLGRRCATFGGSCLLRDVIMASRLLFSGLLKSLQGRSHSAYAAFEEQVDVQLRNLQHVPVRYHF